MRPPCAASAQAEVTQPVVLAIWRLDTSSVHQYSMNSGCPSRCDGTTLADRGKQSCLSDHVRSETSRDTRGRGLHAAEADGRCSRFRQDRLDEHWVLSAASAQEKVDAWPNHYTPLDILTHPPCLPAPRSRRARRTRWVTLSNRLTGRMNSQTLHDPASPAGPAEPKRPPALRD